LPIGALTGDVGPTHAAGASLPNHHTLNRLARGPVRLSGDIVSMAALRHIAMILIAVGMIASLMVIVDRTRAEVAHPIDENTDALFGDPSISEDKGTEYYVYHSVEIVSLLTAGAISFYLYRPGDRSYAKSCFVLLMLAAGVMTVRGYTTSELLSSELVGMTGPVPFAVSLLAFFSAVPRNWRFLRWVYTAWAAAGSVFVVAMALSTPMDNRLQAVGALRNHLNALLFPAAWLVLDRQSTRTWVRFARWLPLAVFTGGSILVQTRLNFVMILTVLGAYFYSERKSRGLLVRVFVSIIFCALVLGEGVLVFSDFQFGQKVVNLTNQFRDRMDEDTRTGQLQEFFADVSPSELVLGRGSRAYWIWGGHRWDSAVDLGYLSLLFFGGLPLLITYCLFHLLPAFQSLRHSVSGIQSTCALVTLLWVIRMFSSSYPGLSADYCFVLFCVGGCFPPMHSEPLIATGYASA
jgi:hypothetical protein